jgi:hypothetical protein
MLLRPRAQQLLTSRAVKEARGLPHLRTFARVFGQGDLLGDAEVIRFRGSLEPGSAVEGDSYSLRLVIKGLDAMGTTYKQSKLGGVDTFVRTGCHVPLRRPPQHSDAPMGSSADLCRDHDPSRVCLPASRPRCPGLW